MKAVPAIGTRLAFRSGTARRVYELTESRNAIEHGCYRHVLRLVEESGYLPAHSAGIGSEIHVEDQWFIERKYCAKEFRYEVIPPV